MKSQGILHTYVLVCIYVYTTQIGNFGYEGMNMDKHMNIVPLDFSDQNEFKFDHGSNL